MHLLVCYNKYICICLFILQFNFFLQVKNLNDKIFSEIIRV
jgi:hypothetical protein